MSQKDYSNSKKSETAWGSRWENGQWVVPRPVQQKQSQLKLYGEGGERDIVGTGFFVVLALLLISRFIEAEVGPDYGNLTHISALIVCLPLAVLAVVSSLVIWFKGQVWLGGSLILWSPIAGFFLSGLTTTFMGIGLTLGMIGFGVAVMTKR